MNENIDLTKILDGCPVGTKFYHVVFGTVCFLDIRTECIYPIRFTACDKCCYSVTSAGLSNIVHNYDGECVLFPSKDQRDWSKFERFWDKPKVEKFDVNTLYPFDKILARDYQDELWSIDFFSHKTGNIVRGLCHNWCYAIPYNEETKHLANKREDCPDYYKWWEK